MGALDEAAAGRRTRSAEPRALLLGGGMDMAHALRAAGARTTVIGSAACPARWSRHGFGWVADPRPGDARLVARLQQLASTTGPAALFYETDRDLLLVSRHRDQLVPSLHLLLPPAELVEQLVDKASFEVLARRLGLPVPPSWVVPTAGPEPVLGAPYPLLVKPVMRDEDWHHEQKAVLVRCPTELQQLRVALAGTHPCLVVQQHVPGPETQVESYHAYVDASGRVAGEFTGRKIRTLPRENGYSTALVTTDAPDLRALGRSVVAALGLVGVAKLDVKRDDEGRLWLLEVNPRFNLWHHLGAAAGVNLPQLVLADLGGHRRPPPATARAGVTWCHVPKDLVAARRSGIGARQWWRWERTCDTSNGLDLGDPLPFLAGKLWPMVAGRVRHPAG